MTTAHKSAAFQWDDPLLLEQQLSADERAFYDAKLRTARYYFERLLPRSGAHFATLMSGSKTMMEFPDTAF